MTDRLHPTPRRLQFLADAADGLLPELLSAAMGELLDAGWIEPDGVLGRWRPTAYGRAIAAVRLVEGADHIVAETGDPDSPRVLGDATAAQTAPKWLWTVRVGDAQVAMRRKHWAREELRHMAAERLAADTPTTVQEGQTP